MNIRRPLPHLHASLLLALFVLLWLLPDAAAWLDRRPDEAWQRVQSTGVIRFASDASYHPFEGVGGDGVFYGLDIDLAHEVARRVGARAEFTNVGIDALYDALRVGQADAAISALPIDPARQGPWAYSQPYFDAGLVLIERKTGEPGLESGDLAGRVIAVVLGSDGDAWLRREQRRVTDIMAERFDSAPAALQAVEEGRADVALVDGVTARQRLAAHFPDLRIATQLTSQPYAIAVWGASEELLTAIDQALDAVRRDGTLARIIEAWMRK